MSGNDPLDPGNFDPRDMFRQLSDLFASMAEGSSGTAQQWEHARRAAVTLASAEGSERNVDPAERIALEDLSRVAELHARSQPGVQLPTDSAIEAVTRSQWTSDAMSVYRPFFERFIEAINIAPPPGAAADPMMTMLTPLMGSLGGQMVIHGAGMMLGHLGQTIVSTYDLPVPRPGSTVQVLPSGMRAIADDTGAPIAEVQLYMLIHDLIAHATLGVPHVAARLEALYLDYASAFRLDPERLAGQFDLGEFDAFGSITDLDDLADLSKLAELSEAGLGDSSAMLDAMRTPAQDLLMPQLDALVSVVLGFVETSTMTACSRLMTGHPAIRDAVRARRTQADDADRFMNQLLGLDVDEATIERGDAFVTGVIERAGPEGLDRLWADELDLPTPAEVDAPGLWLERIGMSAGDSTFEIPDDLSGLD